MYRVLNFVKNLALGCVFLIPLGLLIFTFIKGKEWLWETVIIPIVPPVFWVLLIVSFVLFFPLALIRPTRFAGGILLIISSYVFSALLWIFSLGVVWDLWGLVGTIIGLALGGIGVAPLAFFASLFSGSWGYFLIIIIGAVCLTATRIASACFTSTCEK